MVFNTISVGTAVTPNIIETCFSHYLNRKPLRQKPTAHISYHEGLNLIRRFLKHASFHTVEEIQDFTSRGVPSPHWVKVENVTIPQESISKAADALTTQLGPRGIENVGGSKWWQWRREGSMLEAEWIEMKAHYAKRTENKESSKRIILYVHGGAYYFGSVDAHRYQMQRHARKLEARVFARYSSRYRLAPQFPFPCGLHDCLAAYLYLLSIQDPSTIVLAGDSAGGGMIVSMLVVLRDRGFPLPAGAVLISPWVDLTHSFPSLSGDSSLDYIPSHGFLHRPSESWPPPNADDMEKMATYTAGNTVGVQAPNNDAKSSTIQGVEQGVSVDQNSLDVSSAENTGNLASAKDVEAKSENAIHGPGHHLSITIGGKMVRINDQLQIYTTNQMISHPLVSPVLQPSLGGLPPLLILTGGGELLRDEQIFLAHKAANPRKFPPSEAYLDEYPEARGTIGKWKPTDVQLQVWDDLCHVAPTLSFTRPAKYMYRSIAQFSAWALARAQSTGIQILDDDEVSLISSGSDEAGYFSNDGSLQEQPTTKSRAAHVSSTKTEQVGKAGMPLPAFKNHMIRQRVDRHGTIYPLEPIANLSALQVPIDEIGVIKPGPVLRHIEAMDKWNSKYGKQRKKIQDRRMKDKAHGLATIGNDEVPPPLALAGRRSRNAPEQREENKGRSWAMSLWSIWGSSHDEKTIVREENADNELEASLSKKPNRLNGNSADNKRTKSQFKLQFRRRTVIDAGQTTSHTNKEIPSSALDHHHSSRNQEEKKDSTLLSPSPPSVHITYNNEEHIENTTQLTSGRPREGGVAYPFKLGTHLRDNDANASTITLKSQAGVSTPKDPKANEPLDKSPLAFEATLRSESVGASPKVDSQLQDADQPETADRGMKRPDLERFVTAAEEL